jgi:hypothetical protein
MQRYVRCFWPWKKHGSEIISIAAIAAGLEVWRGGEEVIQLKEEEMMQKLSRFYWIGVAVGRAASRWLHENAKDSGGIYSKDIKPDMVEIEKLTNEWLKETCGQRGLSETEKGLMVHFHKEIQEGAQEWSEKEK